MDIVSTNEDMQCTLVGKCDFASRLPVGVCLCNVNDDNIEIEYANEKFRELSNNDCVKNYSTFLRDFMESDKVRFYELYYDSIRDNKTLKWEGRKNTTGKLKWFRLEANIFSINDKTKFIGVFQDITEQKNIELILRENESRFQGIFSNISNVAIQGYLLDGTVTYWNSAAKDFYGYTPNEAIGNNIIDLIIPDEAKDTVRKELKIMEETTVPIPSGELSMKHKNGQLVTVYSAHTIVNIPNVGSELFCIDTDLSKIKQIEEASRAKTEFLANMSHEIRTPLNAIVGLTHLMRKGGITKKQSERLDQIDSSSRHLLSIINDILDLSKIEAGQMPLFYNEFNLSSLIDTVTSLIGALAKEKGIEIKVDLQDVPLFLNGDAIRLRQALLNYAGNAIKFTEKGSVTIRTKLIEDSGNYLFVKFEVEDTGIGIKQEDIDKLFQPFEQIYKSSTRKNTGTGLGLAITRRLAMLMEGDAGVESEENVGSVFWFTVKLHKGTGEKIELEDKTSDEVELKLRERCSGSRILLAEDNEVNQLVACELLNEVNLITDVADNGEEAVRMYSEKQYDLVLMDVQMPVMDGFDATRAIINNNKDNIVPIIAMTANVFDEGREESKECGMVDFIPKPVDPVQFYNVLYTWLPDKVDVENHLRHDKNDNNEYDWLSLLDDIPELDVDAGMSVANGKHNVYKSILKLFIESHENDIQEISNLVEKKEYDSAERIVHALKGTSGNIGANNIHYYATELDIALKCYDENLIKEPLNKLLIIFPTFMKNLQEQLDKIEKLEYVDENETQESFSDFIDNLYNLLKRGNSKVISYFMNNHKIFYNKLGKMQADKLEMYINNFDFSNAIELLDRYRR